MYYKYFPFKGLDYTRNIVFSLIFLQIFFLRNIFRKLRITMISSSQWSMVSTFWVIWGNERCRLMKPLIFGDYTKTISRFILHFTFIIHLIRLLCLQQLIEKQHFIKGQLSIFVLLNHEESMRFHFRSDETLLHFAFFGQSIL